VSVRARNRNGAKFGAPQTLCHTKKPFSGVFWDEGFNGGLIGTAEEGQQRQIIVFTHDIAFLFLLYESCRDNAEPQPA
jgi:hypothetical protein